MNKNIDVKSIFDSDIDLDIYLNSLKFIVLSDAKNGKPLAIFFGFHYPSQHSEIFEKARKQYAKKGIEVGVQGGGVITKRHRFIIFHVTSQKYGRFEDEVVLQLAPEIPLFKKSKYKDINFCFLSKSGRDDVKEIVRNAI